MGYVHVSAPQAARVQLFYEEHLNDYLNLCRPCGQADVTTCGKGEQRPVYRRYETPWEVYRKLPKAGRS